MCNLYLVFAPYLTHFWDWILWIDMIMYLYWHYKFSTFFVRKWKFLQIKWSNFVLQILR